MDDLRSDRGCCHRIVGVAGLWAACVALGIGHRMAQAERASDGGPRQLRAGACAVDITPQKFPVIVNGGFLERETSHVNDPLFARALVLDNGSLQLAITVVDSCVIPQDIMDEAKRLAQEATGIPAERMLIAATHTHTAPSCVGALGSRADEAYSKFLPGKIAEAVAGAQKNLAPARIGWTVVEDRAHTNCRRWILRPDRVRTDPFGEPTVRAMMHPGYQNPDFIGPAGPIDPYLTILAVQTPQGQPMALLANYSMHYFGSGNISADYYGVFARRIGQLLGAEGRQPAFVGIMAQGTSGDLHWMDYSQPRKTISMESYGDEVARVVHRAYESIVFHDWVPLAVAQTEMTLRRRVPDEKRLTWARQMISQMGQRLPQNIPEVYAWEQVYLHEQPELRFILQAMRIGDLGIAAIPCEVFGITGLKIKAQSPLVPTVNFELANGYGGYIPPPEQHTLGGYTTWPARSAGLEVQAEPKIVEAMLGLLEQVSGQRRRPVEFKPGPYARAVLASKPVAYWRLDDFQGPEAADASANKRPAQYEERIALFLEGADGPGLNTGELGNRAAHFAGGRLAGTLPEIGATYSVELWFWNGLPAEARPVTGFLVSRGPDGAEGAPGDHLGIGGQKDAPGRLFFFNGNQRGQLLTGTTEIPLKTWCYVVLVRDGPKVAVYLNGRQEPEIVGEAAPGWPAGIPQIFIGGRNDRFADFCGKIDEVAVYDRALPASEIASHYQAAVNPGSLRP